MHGKEFILDLFRTFFTVVTLINIVMFFIGMRTQPDARFGYEAFAVPLIYGFAGTLPNVVMYSRRELKVGELVVRKVLQLILIEAAVLFVAFYNPDEKSFKTENIATVAGCILIVYVVSVLLDWLQNYLEAKRMTEELLKFQNNSWSDEG